MIISMDKKYKTRDGRDVRIYCTDAGGVYPVHIAIKREDGTWEISVRTKEGNYNTYSTHKLDLVEVRPRIRREFWMNIYPNENFGPVHKTHTDARRFSDEDCIARVKVTIDCEEGEGL